MRGIQYWMEISVIFFGSYLETWEEMAGGEGLID